MSILVGQSEFNFKESVLKASFLWKFNGHPFGEYYKFHKLCKRGIISTEEFCFETEFLSTTNHHVQCFITMDDYKMFAKVCLEEIDLSSEFTNYTLASPKVMWNFGDGGIRQFVEVNEALKTQMVNRRYFTDEDFESPENGSVFWYTWNEAQHSHYGHQQLKSFTGYVITLDFEFGYCFWNKDKNGMQFSIPGVQENVVTSNEQSLRNPLIPTREYALSEKFSDFIVKCDGKSFPAHRIIIANKSPVIAAMLDKPMKESNEGFLTIPDFKSEIVEEFLKFIYTGKANVTAFAADLFKLSHQYEVSDLKHICESALLSQVNGGNLIKINELGKMYGSDRLMDKCYSFFKLKRSSLLKTAADVDKFNVFMLKFALE